MEEERELLLTFLDVSTILLSFLCKLPQIWTILKAKSVNGISLNSVIVELVGYSIVLGYNLVKGYPLFSFLEYAFLILEDLALLLLIFYYTGALNTLKLGWMGVGFALFYGALQGIPFPGIFPILMKFATPCSASSKLLQLREIWKWRNAESVSILTWALAAYTCVSRIATVAMLTGDTPLLINYVVALSLNCSIVGSAIYFRKERAPPPEKKD